jgi:hypothetical protein
VARDIGKLVAPAVIVDIKISITTNKKIVRFTSNIQITLCIFLSRSPNIWYSPSCSDLPLKGIIRILIFYGVITIHN